MCNNCVFYIGDNFFKLKVVNNFCAVNISLHECDIIELAYILCVCITDIEIQTSVTTSIKVVLEYWCVIKIIHTVMYSYCLCIVWVKQ